MAKKESLITLQIINGLSKICWLKRNHVGCVQDKKNTWHTFGLGKGSPDIVGFLPIVVTEAMVGKKIAVFTGIEVKTEKGKVQEHQKFFLEKIRLSGGVSGVARSSEAALKIIEDFKNEKNRVKA